MLEKHLVLSLSNNDKPPQHLIRLKRNYNNKLIIYLYLRFCCRLSADMLTKSIDLEFVLLAKNNLFLYMIGKIIITEFYDPYTTSPLRT